MIRVMIAWWVPYAHYYSRLLHSSCHCSLVVQAHPHHPWYTCVDLLPFTVKIQREKCYLLFSLFPRLHECWVPHASDISSFLRHDALCLRESYKEAWEKLSGLGSTVSGCVWFVGDGMPCRPDHPHNDSDIGLPHRQNSFQKPSDGPRNNVKLQNIMWLFWLYSV